MDAAALNAAIVERVTVGIVVLDTELRITAWNRFMEERTVRRSDSVVGRPIFDCFPELPKDWLRRQARVVFTVGSFAFSSWAQRPYLFRLPHNRPATGGVDCMRQDVTLMPLRDENGAIARVCLQIVDVTDTAIAHAKLEQSVEELRRTQGELVELSRRAGRADVAAHVLHNVGNALNSLAVATSLARDGARRPVADGVERLAGFLVKNENDLARVLGADRAKSLAAYSGAVAAELQRGKESSLAELDEVARHVERLAALVAEQNQNARAGGVRESVDVRVVVDEAIELEAGAMQVSNAYEEVPPCTVDRLKLRSVIAALVRNAARSVSASAAPRVEVAVRAGDERVEVEVRDNGPGHDSAGLAELFRQDREGSNGLHTAACEAQQLGATLLAHSEGPGLGAVLTLAIPSDPRPREAR